MVDVLTAFGFPEEFSNKLQCQSVSTSSPVYIHVCQTTDSTVRLFVRIISYDVSNCELWQVVHIYLFKYKYKYLLMVLLVKGFCVGSYHLSLVLIAGLECYSVSCSVSINCNLIVPLLRYPLIFERIAIGRCFPCFFYFPSSISFSPPLVSSECLIFVFVPCSLFFYVNVLNFLFASHSHLFFWVLS